MCVENYATNAIDRSSVPLPALPATAWMDANYIGNGAIDRAAFATDATELMGDGIVVTRATGALPQTGALSLFTITGHVLLKRVLGVVTVDVGAVANNTKLVNNSTGAGATTDICGTNNITGDVADTQYTITGTFADAMIATTNLPLAASVDLNILLVPGTLQVDCAGSDGGDGRVRWSVLYQPLEEGASIVAA